MKMLFKFDRQILTNSLQPMFIIRNVNDIYACCLLSVTNDAVCGSWSDVFKTILNLEQVSFMSGGRDKWKFHQHERSSVIRLSEYMVPPSVPLLQEESEDLYLNI